jgi:hypothetical protein
MLTLGYEKAGDKNQREDFLRKFSKIKGGLRIKMNSNK